MPEEYKDTSDYLTPKQLLERVPLTARELADGGRSGKLPRIKFSNKRILYFWPDVQKALEKMTLNPVSSD